MGTVDNAERVAYETRLAMEEQASNCRAQVEVEAIKKVNSMGAVTDELCEHGNLTAHCLRYGDCYPSKAARRERQRLAWLPLYCTARLLAGSSGFEVLLEEMMQQYNERWEQDD